MSRDAVAARFAERAAFVSGIAIAILLVGCGSSPQPSPSATSSPGATISLPTSPSPLDLKPVLSGLLDRSGAPPNSYATALAGFVVNVHWGDLQPTAGTALQSDNAIDRAITTVRALDSADHAHLGLKIRVFAGIWAPGWAKSFGGAPITVTNPQNGATGTIGRFWSDAFGQAYDQFVSLLAAKYDAVPEVREVTISRCTTFYAEPFIRDASDPATVSALVGAGYSLAADENCQRQEIDAAAVWRHTHSDLAFNPYQTIGLGGTTQVDEPFTDLMMVYCRQVLGPACVLENNSLRTPPPPAYQIMYAQMMAIGRPIAFQTEVAGRIGSLQATLSYAVSLGADSVELPGGYESLATPAALSVSAGALARQSVT
jgi:hypothetical protein